MKNFIKAALAAALCIVLSGCAGYPVSFSMVSDCSGGREATYSCQVERYNKAF